MPCGYSGPASAAGYIPAVDVRNLRGGESRHAYVRIVSELHIEIVEVAPCGAHDNNGSGHADLAAGDRVIRVLRAYGAVFHTEQSALRRLCTRIITAVCG